MINRSIRMYIIGALLLGVLVKVAVEQRNARREAEIQAQIEAEREQRRQDTMAAFADPIRPTPEEVTEFTKVFDTLGEALVRNDTKAVTQVFDPERMIAEMERIGWSKLMTPNQAQGFKEGVRTAARERLGEGLVKNQLLRWNRTDIRQVRWSPNRDEAVVLCVHRADDAEDLPLRMRWWLVRKAGEWKLYDLEDLHIGLRFTHIVATLATPANVERFGRDLPAFQRAVLALNEVMLLLARGDFEAADKALAPARKLQLPTPFQAILEVAEGLILLGRGDAKAALARFDTAERLLPGMAVTMFTRGTALLTLDRHNEALSAIRAYQKEIGADGLSSEIEGSAHEKLGNAKEAAIAYRRALDEVPEMIDAFHGLRRVLPVGAKSELGDRLAKARDPSKLYGELLIEIIQDKDEVAADILLDSLRKAKPDDPRGLSDDIRRKVKAGNIAQAKLIMRGALKTAKSEDRTQMIETYLVAMLHAEKMLEAYDAVPVDHATGAFRTLAVALDTADDEPLEYNPKRIKQLKELIPVHRQRVPTDPWLWYYEGVLLQFSKDYQKAAEQFATGRSKLPPFKADPAKPNDRDWDASNFRSRQVACLYHAKQGLEAYEKVDPSSDGFQQLA